MIFVVRYSDGSCGIAEAASERGARALLRSEEVLEDIDIVSVRRLSFPFVSRWFFDHKDSEVLLEVACLSGRLGHDVTDEVLDHEYPTVATAYAISDDEEQFCPSNAQEINVILNRAELEQAQREQMERCDNNLKRRLRQAVAFELERCKAA